VPVFVRAVFKERLISLEAERAWKENLEDTYCDHIGVLGVKQNIPLGYCIKHRVHVDVNTTP